MKRFLIVYLFFLASFESYSAGDIGGRIFIGSESNTTYEEKNLVFPIGQTSIILYYAADSYDYCYDRRKRYCDYAKLRIKINGNWQDLTGYEDIGQLPGQRVHWTINISNFGPGEYPIEVYRYLLTCEGTGSGTSSTLKITNTLTGGKISVASTTVCNNATVTFSEATPSSGGYGSYSYKWQYKYSGSSSYYSIPNKTDQIMSGNGIGDGFTFRRCTTDAYGNVAYSNEITMSVYPTTVNAGQIGTNTPTVCSADNEFRILNVTDASGGSGTYTYSWYRQPVTGGYQESISNNSNDSREYTGSVSSAYKFTRRATDQCGFAATTSPVTISMAPPLTPGTIKWDNGTSSKEICPDGSPGTIRNGMAATGGLGVIYYTWQYSNTNSSPTNYFDIVDNKGAPITGADYSPADTFTYDKGRKLYFFRRVAHSSQGCGTQPTEPVSLAPAIPVTSAGQISIENLAPDNESTTICYGVKPVINNISEKEGGTGYETYQWEYRLKLDESDWSGWLPISGAIEKDYRSSIGATQTISYRRSITGVCNVGIISNEVTFNVLPQVTAGEIAADTTVCYGAVPAPIRSKITASGGTNSSYLWKYSIDGTNFTALPAVKNVAAYTFDETESLTQPIYYFKRQVLNDCLSDREIVETSPIRISVKPNAVAEEIGLQSQFICPGELPSTLNNTNNAVSKADRFQWYQSSDEVNWSAITDAVGQSFSPGVLKTTTYYQRESLYTNDGYTCGSAFGNTATVSVRDSLNPGVIGYDQYVFRNTVPDKLGGTPATGAGNIEYQWQTFDDGEWKNIPMNSQSAELTLGAQTLDEQIYRRRVYDRGCNVSKLSEPVGGIKIKCVDDLVAGQISPEDTTVCYAATVKFTGAAMNQSVYKWQKSDDAVSWEDINFNASNPYYTSDPLTGTTFFRRKTTHGDQTVVTGASRVTVIGRNNPLTLKDDWKTAYCLGEPVILEVNPNYGYAYYWTDDKGRKISDNLKYEIAELQSESIVHIVSIDNQNQCEQSKPITITIDNVNADFSASVTNVALGKGARFTNLSQGASNYEWDFGEGEGANATTNFVYYFNIPGTKTIKLTAISENGCTAEKVMESYITVSGSKDIGEGELPTGTESKESTDVVIYPNPVDDVLYVRYENSAPEKAEIFDAKGRLLLQQKITGQPEAIQVSSLPAGVYVLKLTGKNNVKNIKFIKE
ncbi:MAG: T9SS type A sorting domain-containing protein [Tannerella sp.]|jgi:hypothetical protein|nr:T9SS type A sorting domain-containing protein [Tannerella sp.]